MCRRPPACPTVTPRLPLPSHLPLLPQARAAVRRVAQLFPTAIISGRGRDKVQAFVQLGELYYAGSHGMDIAGPVPGGGDGDGADRSIAFQPAAQFAPLMDAMYQVGGVGGWVGR